MNLFVRLFKTADPDHGDPGIVIGPFSHIHVKPGGHLIDSCGFVIPAIAEGWTFRGERFLSTTISDSPWENSPAMKWWEARVSPAGERSFAPRRKQKAA